MSDEAKEQTAEADPNLSLAKKIYVWCLIGVVGIYAVSGITVIGPSEVAIVLRMGQVRTSDEKPLVFQPGLLFAYPKPFADVIRVPVREERSIEVRLSDDSYELRQAELSRRLDDEAERREQESSQNTSNLKTPDASERPLEEPAVNDWALTGDRQALAVHVRAKYRISDPVAFALVAVDPDAVGARVLRSAITSTLNHWSVDESMRLRSQRLVGAISLGDAEGDSALVEVADVVKRAKLPSDPTISEVHQALQNQQLSEDQISQATDVLMRLAPVPVTLSEAIRLRAQGSLEELGVGLTITALEIQEVSPPTETTIKAFEAVQSARIAQESLADVARGEGNSEIINKQLLSSEYVADANGKRSTRLAEAKEQADEFLAALSVLRNSDPVSEQSRLFYDAWQQIMDQSTLFLVSPGDQETRLRIVPAGDDR